MIRLSISQHHQALPLVMDSITISNTIVDVKWRGKVVKSVYPKNFQPLIFVYRHRVRLFTFKTCARFPTATLGGQWISGGDTLIGLHCMGSQ